MAEIKDGSATFEVRSITDMYKEIQQLKEETQTLQQAMTSITLPISNNNIKAQKTGNLVIISFDGFPNGTSYPTGWGVSVTTLDIGYKARETTQACLACQSVVDINDDGNIVAWIIKGESTINFRKYSGNGSKVGYWARGQIVIPIEE